MSHFARRHQQVLVLGATLVLAGCVTACGSSTKSQTGATPTTTSGSGSPSGAGAGRGSFPGASGSVAAVTASSIEVQNPQSGQVTVSWKPATTFTRTVKVAASSVAAGDCVTVTGTTTGGTLVAKTVVISQASGGTCARTFGGGQRFGGRGASGTRTPPTGGPGAGSARRSGSAGRGFGGASGMSFASGKVASVTSSTLVVSGLSSGSFTKTASTKATANAVVKVGLASSTTYTETRSAASSGLAVGDCVTATGTTSSTGAVSASTIRITSTGGKSCTSGFGGFGGGAAGD